MRTEGHFITDLADPDKNLAVADPDRMIYSDIRVECDMDRRHGSLGVIPRKGFFIKVSDLIQQGK